MCLPPHGCVPGIGEDTRVPCPLRPPPGPIPPSPTQGLSWGLTVDDEVDLSGVRLAARLEGASVEALVAQPHLGDEDGELLGRVGEQPHPRVTGPAVVARVQDVGAVQPGHSGHMLVDEAAGGEDKGRVVFFYPSPLPGPPGSPVAGAWWWWEEDPLQCLEAGVTVPTLQVGKLSLSEGEL